MVQISYDNARLELSRVEELFPRQDFGAEGFQVTLLGKPGWLVNYEDLAYETNAQEIQDQTQRLIAAYLADDAQSHQLARLSGVFCIVLAKAGSLRMLITSDDFPNRVYHYQEDGQLLISDDPFAFARQGDPLNPASYDQDNLRYIGKKKTCIPGQTYVKGLKRLRPATIYKVEEAELIPQRAVYYQGAHEREYDYEDFYAVVGRRLEPGDYSLCYSTGIDSHHLLMTFRDRITDVSTVYYQAPHQDAERSQEAATGLINAARVNKPFNLIAVSHDDPKNLPLLEHAVDRDPFASHYSYSQYQLFKEARSQRIMTGQNADTLQFFGLTSPIPWHHLGGKSRILNYASTWERVVYRRRVQQSFNGLRDPELVNRRLFYGHLDKFEDLVGPHGYWPILYFKRINNMTSGNTRLFKNAAAYHGKKVFFPYIEPLVFHVSAFFQRKVTQLLNPKRHLRSRHKYLQHTSIPLELPQGLAFDQSWVFSHIAGDLDQVSLPLRKHFDSLVKDPIARIFVYQFVLESLAPKL